MEDDKSRIALLKTVHIHPLAGGDVLLCHRAGGGFAWPIYNAALNLGLTPDGHYVDKENPDGGVLIPKEQTGKLASFGIPLPKNAELAAASPSRR